MRQLLLGALTWEPQIKGALYVIIAVVVLPGSVYLILSTNLGARVGFLVAAAGFFGWMTTLGGVWWVYGRGPVGRAPAWKPVEVVTGDIAEGGRNDVLAEFPKEWDRIPKDDPEVADALPVADSKIVGPKAVFKSASEYLVTTAADKGGDTYGPLHLLNFRPFDFFHEPHYLLIQVQRAAKAEPVPGQPAPRATVDPSARPVAVLMVRDLGSVRKNPAVVAICCALLFGVTCYKLHVRDKEAAAARG